MTNPDWRILDLHKVYFNIIVYYKMKGIYEEYKDTIEYKYLKTTCCNFLKRMLAIKDKEFRRDVIDESWCSFCKVFPDWRNNPYLKSLNVINLYLRLMSRPFISLLKIVVR